MIDDKNILIASSIIKRKNKKLMRMKFFKKLKKKRTLKLNMKTMMSILIFILIIISIFTSYLLLIKKKRNQKLKKLNFENISYIFNYSLKYEEFDDIIKEKYIQLQNNFCAKHNTSLIPEYEKIIIKTDADFYGKKFEMFVYKKSDAVSNSIISSNKWEGSHTLNVLKALEYYSNKKNLKNEDIYLLDIGGNVGWYTFFLGKLGYKILSFEANEINNYILYKNYCIIKDVNVILINKGLDVEDKTCILKTDASNKGNGMIFCENREKNLEVFDGDIHNNIELTKLSRYYKYLSNKNLAFIKLDVEGSEANVFEGGKKLITKYHVPFIKLEFEVRMIEAHRNNAFEFLQFFENNGYKISLKDFFSKEYISSTELAKSKGNNNLYIVYEKILE